MRNPDEYCIHCDYRFFFWEESCPECGFDPIHNASHDAQLTEAQRKYYEQLG